MAVLYVKAWLLVPDNVECLQDRKFLILITSLDKKNEASIGYVAVVLVRHTSSLVGVCETSLVSRA
jgi:hypothetical protein